MKRFITNDSVTKLVSSGPFKIVAILVVALLIFGVAKLLIWHATPDTTTPQTATEASTTKEFRLRVKSDEMNTIPEDGEIELVKIEVVE